MESSGLFQDNAQDQKKKGQRDNLLNQVYLENNNEINVSVATLKYTL